MRGLALAALSLALMPAATADRSPVYTLTATRDCRAPGVAHRTLPRGSLIRFTSPGIGGRVLHVSRRPGWRPVRAADYAGNASVFTDREFGIAARRLRRGGFYFIVSPNGRWALHVQTDYGPHPGTGRWLDLTPEDAGMHGYGGTSSTFPTDVGSWTGWFYGYRRPVGLRAGALPSVSALGVCRLGAPGLRRRVSFRVLRRGPE